MILFEYGQTELDHLIRREPKLAPVIERAGRIEREVTQDPFAALVFSVIGQQISGKAADTICRKLLNRIGTLTPEILLNTPEDDLRLCGLSARKVSYIQGIAEAGCSGAVNFGSLHTLSDELLVSALVALRGVGIWTAEMLLIFSFRRPDIVSFGDLGIRKGLGKLYGKEKVTPADFERFRKRVTPYGSIASFYLWHLASEKIAK